MNRLLPFLFALALALGFVSTAKAEEAKQVETISLPSNLDTKSIREAIASSLGGRGWAIQEQSDTRVIAYLKHRKNEAEVTYTFDTKQINVSCWGYATTKAGARIKPELPEGWLRILSQDIRKRLGMSIK